MKIAITYTTAMMMTLGAAMVSAQAPAAPDTGYTATVRNSWNSVKRFVVGSAEKMPAEHYGFKPTPEVRSFGELIGHLANEHYLLCSPLKGEANPMAKVDFEKTTGKAELVKAITESNAYCDAAYASMMGTRSFACSWKWFATSSAARYRPCCTSSRMRFSARCADAGSTL